VCPSGTLSATIASAQLILSSADSDTSCVCPSGTVDATGETSTLLVYNLYDTSNTCQCPYGPITDATTQTPIFLANNVCNCPLLSTPYASYQTNPIIDYAAGVCQCVQPLAGYDHTHLTHTIYNPTSLTCECPNVVADSIHQTPSQWEPEALACYCPLPLDPTYDPTLEVPLVFDQVNGWCNCPTGTPSGNEQLAQYNSATLSCICPSSVSTVIITNPLTQVGQYYSVTTGFCECPSLAASVPDPSLGQWPLSYNTGTSLCECPNNSQYDSTNEYCSCSAIPVQDFTVSLQYDSGTGACVCPSGTSLGTNGLCACTDPNQSWDITLTPPACA
jgi:hypothetical protein